MPNLRTLSVAAIICSLLAAAYLHWRPESDSVSAPLRAEAASAAPAGAPQLGAPAPAREGAPQEAEGGDALSELQARVARATAALGIEEEEIAEHATAPLEQIEEELAALRETARELRVETLALQEQHRALLAEGKSAEAERLVAERIMPMYEERQGLVREAVLLARVRAVATQRAER